MPDWLSRQGDRLRLRLKATPGAARSEVRGIEPDGRDQDGGRRLMVRVTAVAAGGEANAALVKLLAKRWRLPASAFTITAGMTGRRKTIEIAAIGEDQLVRLRDIEGDDC
jgi:uncharacterized protein YggU (UPF0235/DUF167 family)